jgi:hypothetical protein
LSFYIIIDPPTFTESGRFAILLAGNPCDNPAFHVHLKEGSQYMCSEQSVSKSGDLAISLVDFAFFSIEEFRLQAI